MKFSRRHHSTIRRDQFKSHPEFRLIWVLILSQHPATRGGQRSTLFLSEFSVPLPKCENRQYEIKKTLRYQAPVHSLKLCFSGVWPGRSHPEVYPNWTYTRKCIYILLILRVCVYLWVFSRGGISRIGGGNFRLGGVGWRPGSAFAGGVVRGRPREGGAGSAAIC